MSNIYNNKWSRTVFRVINSLGLAACLFFMAVSVFKIQPMFLEFELLTTQVVFIALSVWLISLILNGMSMIDVAARKSKLEEKDDE